MKLHDTQITNYLTFCKSQKCLDVKTIRAYKIDLTHFASTMPAETSLYDIASRQIESYIAHLHSIYKPKTAKRKIASLKRMIKDPNCTNRKNLFSVSDLDQLVLEEIKKLALDRSAFDSLAPESNTGTDDMDLYRERLDSIDRQMERILNLYQAGVMELDEISERMSELKEQRAEVAEALEGLQDEDERILSKSEAWDMVCSLSDIIEHGTPDELFALVHTLIEKIVVLNGEITIHWAFC